MTVLARRYRAMAVGVLLLLANPASAQRTLGVTATQRAGDFRAQVGKRLGLVCPADDAAKATVYGTDTYAEFSAICAAAIHAGALKLGQAGLVSIVVGGEMKSFAGSARNGITSQSYGPWGYSFTFARDAVPPTIDWTTVWNQIPPGFGEPIAVACPAGGKAEAAIWGTDVYTIDSSICVAAVHAGVISAEKGGVVTATRATAPPQYAGTERHGVTSQRWGSARDAFSVAAATVAATPARTGQPAVATASTTPAPAPAPPTSPLDNATVVPVTPLAVATFGAPAAPPSSPPGPSTPAITQVSPSSGAPGTSLGVRITASGTHFASGTFAEFGPGISVASVTVSSATTATAVIRIDPFATAGARTVTLRTGTEVVTANNDFSVVGITPDSFGKSCEAMTQLGTIPSGTQIVRDGVLHQAGIEDWFYVTFPAGTVATLTARSVSSVSGSKFGVKVLGSCGSPPIARSSPDTSGVVLSDSAPRTVWLAVFAQNWSAVDPGFRLTVVVNPAPPDTVPDAFQFPTKYLAAPLVSIESDPITVSGVTAATPIFIDGNADFSINGRPYTNVPATVRNGDSVRLRMTIPAFQTQRYTTVTIGGVSAQWRLTALPDL